MKRLSKILALVLALLLAFSVLTACSKSDDGAQGSQPSGGQSGQSAGDQGGQSAGDQGGQGEQGAPADSGAADHSVTIGVVEANNTHDPLADGQVKRWQTDNIFEKLIELNPNTQEFDYSLATNIEYLDETTLRVELRDNVYFTDGQKLTSKDVFYCLKDLWAAGRQGSYFVSYDWDNSKIVDDLTIEFKFKQVFGPAITYLGAYGIFCYDDLFGENPVDADKWMYAPNGTGPYVCTENVASAYAVYERKSADQYWGELPQAEKVTYKYYSEPSAMYIDFEAGNIDVANSLSATDAQRVVDGDCPDFTGYYIQSAKDNVMCILSEGKEIWNDERVRRAFALSLNCEAVALANYGCLYLPADSILPPSISYYEPQGTYEYDPETAKSLLAEAGYPDGMDLRLIVTQNFQVLAEALQASVAAAGFRVSVESYDPGTAIPMMIGMESDFIIKEATGGAFVNEPGQLVDTLSPDSTLTPAKITDPEWAACFEESAYNTDPAKRAEGFAGMQKYCYDTCRVIPICERQNMTVYNTTKIESFVFPCNDSPVAKYVVFK